MRQENLDYLKDQIKGVGFTGDLEKELKKNMESQEPRFQIKSEQEFGKDKIDATLNFRRSDTEDTYYFNSYDAALKHENTQKIAPKQTFFVGRNNTFSLDEAYNLLNNRFVNKNMVNLKGEAYNGWVKLNFKESDPNGNYKMQHYTDEWKYDLGKALDKNPLLKELANGPDREKIMDSLKKGNRHEITLVQDGVKKKAYLEANPFLRSVSITDESNQKISLVKKEGQAQSQQQGENMGRSNKEDNKQGQGKKNDQAKNQRQKNQVKTVPNANQKNTRRRRQGIS